MIQTYYAYLLLAGGYVLGLALPQVGADIWLVPAVPYVLVGLSMLHLRRSSRWYCGVGAASAVCAALALAQGLTDAPAVATLLVLVACAADVLLCLAMAAQRRRYGLGAAAEYALFVLAVVFGLGAAALLLMGTQLLAGFARVGGTMVAFDPLTVINTAGLVFRIGMIVDVFRLQREALRHEVEAQK